MPSQDITLLLYSVISSPGDLVSVSLKSNYKNREMNSPKEELNLTMLCRIGILVQI